MATSAPPGPPCATESRKVLLERRRREPVRVPLSALESVMGKLVKSGTRWRKCRFLSILHCCLGCWTGRAQMTLTQCSPSVFRGHGINTNKDIYYLTEASTKQHLTFSSYSGL